MKKGTISCVDPMTNGFKGTTSFRSSTLELLYNVEVKTFLIGNENFYQ